MTLQGKVTEYSYKFVIQGLQLPYVNMEKKTQALKVIWHGAGILVQVSYGVLVQASDLGDCVMVYVSWHMCHGA